MGLAVTSFRKALSLSAHEVWLLAQALVLLPLTLCGIHLLGVSRWQRFLSCLASSETPFKRTSSQTSSGSPESSIVRGDGAAANERARAIARMVDIAAHHGVYQANCLQQTLVLWCLLQRNSIESDICFGARKQAGQLQAHAWVECRGVALNEDGEVGRHFSPFEGVAVAAESETW